MKCNLNIPWVLLLRMFWIALMICWLSTFCSRSSASKLSSFEWRPWLEYGSELAQEAHVTRERPGIFGLIQFASFPLIHLTSCRAGTLTLGEVDQPLLGV